MSKRTENKHDRRVKAKATERRTKITSPCGRPPTTPDDLFSEFFVRPSPGRHNRRRLRARWGEVTTDTSGFHITIRRYTWELQYSANDVDWYLEDRRSIAGKFDDDDDEKVHLVEKGIRANLAYRWRVRAVADDGCKSAWTAWEEMGTPGAEEPPAPGDVAIKRRTDGILLDWTDPTDTDDDDILDQTVDHYVAELNTSSGFGTSTVVKKKRRLTHSQVRFHVDVEDYDEDAKFYGRVRSVGDEGDKSAWIPATKAGNSDSGATAEGRRPKGQRQVFHFTITGTALVQTYPQPARVDDDYYIRRVTAACNTAPTTGTAVIDITVNGTSIFANSADMCRIPAGDTAGSTKDIKTAAKKIERGDKLRVRIENAGAIADMTIQVVCDRRKGDND